MDATDYKIIALLQNDASLSVGMVAERLNLSKSACWRRIQKLEEDGVIRQRVALIAPEKIGLNLMVFIYVRTNQHNQKWADNFRQTVELIPGIMEVYRMGGDVDYLLKAMVRDMQDYDRLYQRLIHADLFDVTAGFVMETIKLTTELPLDQLEAKQH